MQTEAMMLAPKISLQNHYCGHCMGTIKHKMSPDGTTAICQQCGRIKHVMRKRPAEIKLEELLNAALGIKEEAEPKPIKPEGEEHTSAAGAHRFDKGVKFIQMTLDSRFGHKANEKSLKA